MCDSQTRTQLIPANVSPLVAARGMAGSLRHVRQLEFFLRQPRRRIGALLHSGHRSTVLPGEAQYTLEVEIVLQT